MSFDIFRFFCFTGMALIAMGVSYSAARYHGREGERYSLLNHYISELGEVGVSRAAWAFNYSLVAGGLLMLPYIVGLGIRFGSLLGWLGMLAGLVATLGVAAVGVFPMNNLDPHAKAAMTYFRSGLVMVFFFGLAIVFPSGNRTAVHPLSNLLSLVTFGAYAAFLFLARPPKPPEGEAAVNPLDPTEKITRPRFWLMPVLEWAVFFATMLWLFGMAFFI